MTKVIDYKKILNKDTIFQKKAIEKMFKMLEKYQIDKKFNVSKEELIIQGQR